MIAAEHSYPAARRDAPSPTSEAVQLVRDMAQAFEQRILAAEAASCGNADALHTMRHWESHLVHLSRVSTLGTLAASIAHEIRQPLTTIQVETYAIQRWMHREIPNLAEIDEGVRRIQGESERAERVIRSLRALMRCEPASSQPFAIGSAIADVLPLIEAALQEANIATEIDIEAGLPLIQGDRVQIQQVVLNLLLNAMDAVRHCPQGTAALRLSARRHGVCQVVIAITDNGKGIVPADLERVFTPFFSTRADGMGVGLAICRLIAEAHGGNIHATSQPGHTTITMHLPAIREAANS